MTFSRGWVCCVTQLELGAFTTTNKKKAWWLNESGTMRERKITGGANSYAEITSQLLNLDKPLQYSLEYLLDNYGDRAVPALIQALPSRPWFEQQLILEALGKLGDQHAIKPICALLYEKDKAPQQLESSVVQALHNLVYYSDDKKKATQVLIDTMLQHEHCIKPLTNVLKEQHTKFAIKLAYKKLFKQNHQGLKESAISVIGEEEGYTKYRIRFMKKMLRRVSDSRLKNQIIAALKVLITKKLCQNLCNNKGMKFDAFFKRPENDCYDCCCLDKTNKRILIPFEGGVVSGNNSGDRGNVPNPMRQT